MKNPFHLTPTPRTCPHGDCGKIFCDVIYKHGIIFCPHCQKSLLVNPFTPDLQQMTFWQLVKYFIKRYYKLYAICTGIFILIYTAIFAFDGLDKFNLTTGFWVAVIILIMFLFFVAIVAIENNLRYYHAYKIKNRPLIKGVDNYDDVKNDFNISVAHDKLATSFDAHAPYCPHCQSQRFHNTADDDYVCQKCHTKSSLNPKLKNTNTIQFVLNYIILFLIIGYVSFDFYLFIYILAVFVIFLINLSINYYWYKTPKWLP